MTRRFAKLATAYLLLGFVMTLVVAWVCGTRAEFDNTMATIGSRIAGRAETGGAPAYAALHRFTAPGVTFYSSVMFFDRDSVVPGWPTPEDVATGWARRAVVPRFHASLSESERPTFGRVQIEAVGWPRRALWCEYVAYRRGERGQNRAEGALVIHDAGTHRPMHGGKFPLVLALRPLAGGLLADTLFYAAVLAGLHRLPELSRSWLRRRRGLCPICAYDLTGITGPCPECGRERENA